MSKKKPPSSSGIVFSTDPNFKLENDEEPLAATVNPAQQKLRIRLDTKQRAGKAVTLVENHIGPDAELQELGKKIKGFCGTGGSVKDGVVIIQGDQRDKVLQWLLKNDYKNSKKI